MEHASCDVVIVGAGAAGLAAAAELARAGHAVQILEARDRIGGRIWTRTEPGVSAPIELGAEFIHGYAPVTRTLLTQAGIPLLEFPDSHWRVENGKLLEHGGHFEQVREAMRRSSSALSHADMSLDEFLESDLARDLSPQARETARRTAEGFDAADPKRASARALAEEWTSEDMTSAPQSRPYGGYGPLLSHLASTLASHDAAVRMQTVVRAIAWSRRGVEVEAAALGGGLRVTAKRAIVTLPLGILQRPEGAPGAVKLTPPLTAKRAALQGLGYGAVLKLVLRFRSAFWEELENGRFRDAGFFHARMAPFPTFWTQLPLRVPLLVAWLGGPRAAERSSSETRDLVPLVIESLGCLFGKQYDYAGLLEAVYWHNWQQDPFSAGAYSYVAVGGDTARSDLAAPLGNTLFFAGEATDHEDEASTVTGALRSGMRAAREVIASL